MNIDIILKPNDIILVNIDLVLITYICNLQEMWYA